VLPLANNNETHSLIVALPSSRPLLNVPKVTPRKIFDADCTTSYVLNSRVTDPISTNANYYPDIKIVIFQSILDPLAHKTIP